MTDLTERQKELLKSIVELYVKNGEPIGSENIEREYHLGVSPATIRAEMVRLTEGGFLKQPHTSAGRIPTSMGFRLYINELMREKELPVSAEVSIKENLWQRRFETHKLLREATKALAMRSQMLALIVNDDGEIFYAGAANILEFPEFSDIDVARFVLGLFDEFPTLQQILGKAVGPDPMHVLFGEDMEYEDLFSTSFVFCRYQGRDEKGGVIGVLGPARMNFPTVLPLVRYTSKLISQALNSW
jgi:transcriptional regulator of heat shock response